MVSSAGRTVSRHRGSRAPSSAQVRRAQPSARRVRGVWCFLGAAGLVLVITGSFLPWIVSGTVRRSSYAIVGVVGRLGIGEGGALGLLIRAWPLLGVLCMTPVVAACLRCWRTAGGLGIVVGLTSGVLAFGVLLVATGRVGLSVRLDPVGPAVMAAGAGLLIGSGTALLLRIGSPVRRF